MIVPYSPGGGYDAYARLVAQYIKAPLGVAKVIVKNDPGGGGLIGTNKLYAAAPDGLTIGATNGTGDIMDAIFGAKGVNFNINKLSWLGRPDHEVHVIVFGPSGPGAPSGGYKTFAQLEALKGTSKAVDVLASGVGSSGYYEQIAIWGSFGIPFKMVAAYKGSKSVKAGLLRGDGSIVDFGYGSLRTLIKAGKVTPVMQLADTRWSGMPNVPTVIELAQQQNLSATKITDLKGVVGIESMGHTFAAPPGIPAARLAFLRAAFKTAVTNPAFVAAANKANRYPAYASASTVQSEVSAGMAVGNDLKSLASANK